MNGEKEGSGVLVGVVKSLRRIEWRLQNFDPTLGFGAMRYKKQTFLVCVCV